MKFMPFITLSFFILSKSLAAVDLYTFVTPTKFETVESNEREKIKQFSEIIKSMQNRKSVDQQTMKRAFHAKSHGCLKGEFRVASNLHPSLQHGLFKTPGKSYEVLGRFSNGVGFFQKDATADVKGFAFKVRNVEGERLINLPELDMGQVQDFTMTNNPTPLADNVENFVNLGMAVDKGLLHGLRFLFQNQDIAKIVIKRIYGRKVKTLVNESFWSGSPYLLGPEQAVKWNVTPCQLVATPTVNENDENFLRTQLQNTLNSQDVCFNFNVQIQYDKEKQPIERHLIEWKESETPSINIAQIIFPAALNQNFSQNDEHCEKLPFNPWNGLKAHQPLGNMNRARGQIYLDSFANRTQFNQKN